VSLSIHVDPHPGYKANERPCRFELDGEIYDIVSIEDRWREPNATFFRVRTVENKKFVLRYAEPPTDEWTLQSGFDGDDLLARRNIHLITIGTDVIKRAERMLAGCQRCRPDEAQVPFSWVLDKVTGSDPKTVDYFITEPVYCPKCSRPLTEYSLVDLKDEDDGGDHEEPDTPELLLTKKSSD
jgi:hypothetical protein